MSNAVPYLRCTVQCLLLYANALGFRTVHGAVHGPADRQQEVMVNSMGTRARLFEFQPCLYHH